MRIASLSALAARRAAARGKYFFLCARVLKCKNRGGVFRHRNYGFLLNFKCIVFILVPDFSTTVLTFYAKFYNVFVAWDFVLDSGWFTCHNFSASNVCLTVMKNKYCARPISNWWESLANWRQGFCRTRAVSCYYFLLFLQCLLLS